MVTAISDSERRVLICSCDDTMPLDVNAIRRGCRHETTAATQLCGTELDAFRAMAAQNGPLTVACTARAALFSDLAAESGRTVSIQFTNIREAAGWSSEADRAGPKMAALLSAAAEPAPAPTTIELQSGGVILIYGRDETAIEAGNLLKDHLDVTVLIEPPAAMLAARTTVFPVARGKVAAATGHFGAFEVEVEDFAEAVPSSRRALTFAPPRRHAHSSCDIILDLTGGAPLFAAVGLREGYLRADPGSPSAMLQAVLKARDLIGTFEKPRYVNFESRLCAHSRSQRTGCTRCLDLCPAGAIAPAGNYVAIDANICAGCGQCAAACPTGAVSYALPPEDALMRRLRAMLLAYRDAGGERAIVLLHDGAHGEPLIDALARHGDGLPANVLPFGVNEVTQVGLENIAAAFAYGASALRFLLPARLRHDISGLIRTMALADPILSGLGFGSGRVATVETDDPDILLETLRAIPPLPSASRAASFRAVGKKRDVLRLALGELHRSAPVTADIIALPAGAPFGAVEIDAEGCTLCLSCVSACPTSALRDDPERPALRFVEDACVQCGLCQATCPEDVITLVPRINFGTAKTPSRILKEEEPFCCIRCGRPFGVKSSIERVLATLQDKHWMYTGSPNKLDVIKMCDNCRVGFVAEQGFESYGAPPAVRTTDDYLRERDKFPSRPKNGGE
jgi:ferredoxin